MPENTLPAYVWCCRVRPHVTRQGPSSPTKAALHVRDRLPLLAQHVLVREHTLRAACRLQVAVWATDLHGSSPAPHIAGPETAQHQVLEHSFGDLLCQHELLAAGQVRTRAQHVLQAMERLSLLRGDRGGY